MLTTITMPSAEVEIPTAQVLRYMGYGRAHADEHVSGLIADAIARFYLVARYRACFMPVGVEIDNDRIHLGALHVQSASLSRNLAGCERAILFAATAGMETERQRKQAAVTSPALSVALDTVGTTAIEAFCDLLCQRFAQESPGLNARPRFSPGYADLPLATQKPLLDLLQAGRLIGVTLTDALLMLPQKSVSAIVGLAANGCTLKTPDCACCSKRDCAFRL